MNAVLGDRSATATILDEEGPIAFWVTDAMVGEGNSGTRQANFIVSVSTALAPGESVSVGFQTADGTAQKDDNDYVSDGGTLTFASGGNTSQVVPIDVIGDFKGEPPETFSLNLSGPSPGAEIGDLQATGTILNDD